MKIEEMKIEAKVNLLNSSNNVKALASITIEDCFVVTGIRVIETEKGFFSSMPSKRNASGEYKDICFPITSEARNKINDEILKKYYEKVGETEHGDAWEDPSASSIINDDELPF